MPTTDVGRARLLLDTHVWVWHSEGLAHLLSIAAIQAVEEAAEQSRLLASTISIWEIALKVAAGSITLPEELSVWVRLGRRRPGIRLEPLTADIMIDSTRLPTWTRANGKPHKDPADRWIVATARQTGALVVTCDRDILDYAAQGHVQAFDARP